MRPVQRIVKGSQSRRYSFDQVKDGRPDRDDT